MAKECVNEEQSVPPGFEFVELRKYPRSYVLQFDCGDNGCHRIRVLRPLKRPVGIDARHAIRDHSH